MQTRDRKVNPHKETLQALNVKDAAQVRLRLNRVTVDKNLRDVVGVVIVVHKLPVIIERDFSGSMVARLDDNLTYVHGFLSCGIPIKWVGMLPSQYLQHDRQQLLQALAVVNCTPVIVDEENNKYGIQLFAKTRIWQLFHYSTLKIEESGHNYSEKNIKEWNSFKSVNMEVARKVLEAYQDNWFVWVYDYHNILVPGFLRIQNPNMVIGYFQQIPFPSNEYYSMFPFRTDLLKAVLCSNLVGFNGYDYKRHFLRSSTYLLGVTASNQGIDALSKGGCFVRVGAYPISLDINRFLMLQEDQEFLSIVEELKEMYAGKKIVLGIDKIDFPKGLLHKLFAYSRFLKENPDWRNDVVYLQFLGNPGKRANVADKQKLFNQINEYVTKINGQYGTIGHMPIQHFCKKIEYKRLMALMSIADVMFVTALRDGMNLTSLEYVAMQAKNKGVLILSEFTGAQQSLASGAIVVNPWNLKETSNSIKQALEISEEERISRYENMHNYLINHTAQSWVIRFLKDLKSSKEELSFSGKIPSLLPYPEVLSSFQASKKRLIILGVIDIIGELPKGKLNPLQFQGMIYVPYQIKQDIRQLAQDPRNVVCLISQLSARVVDRLFLGMPIWLVAENGYYYKHGTEAQWEKLHEASDLSWREDVIQTFQHYTQNTPGSYIIGQGDESVCVSWNYGFSGCSLDFQNSQASNALISLSLGPLANGNAEVLSTNQAVEVRPLRTNAQAVMDRLLELWGGVDQFDFILTIGKFNQKDEDIYRFFTGGKFYLGLREGSRRSSYYSDDEAASEDTAKWMCTIDRKITFADYYLSDPKGLISTLAVAL